MSTHPWINQTVQFVKESLVHAEAGHDWQHIERVWKLTLRILQTEKGDALTCQLAALLHDIADSKFHGGNHDIGPQKAKDFLQSLGVEAFRIEMVGDIIYHISYSQSLSGKTYYSDEWAIVQDADRLDALGAIGIARTFHYGGFRNRPLYDLAIPPMTDLTQQAYQNSQGPTINHFYEKLLRLKDTLHTETARQMAIRRHAFLEEFLQQFYGELNGTH
jgi:uncharacterized protein